MEEWLKQNILHLVITSIFSIIVYIFQKRIEKQISERLEKFKKDLSEDLYKFKTRYSFFYQKQAEAIIELYKKIYRVEEAAVELVKPMQLKNNLVEKKILAETYYNDAVTFFNENKLLFNESIIEQTNKNLEIVKEVLIEFDTAQIATKGGRGSYKNVDGKEWIKAWKKLEDNLPQLIKEFEKALKEVITI